MHVMSPASEPQVKLDQQAISFSITMSYRIDGLHRFDPSPSKVIEAQQIRFEGARKPHLPPSAKEQVHHGSLLQLSAASLTSIHKRCCPVMQCQSAYAQLPSSLHQIKSCLSTCNGLQLLDGEASFAPQPHHFPARQRHEAQNRTAQG